MAIESLLMTDFQALGLSKQLLRAVEAEGYTTPTPVQEQSIPPLLAGRDVLGVAQTGTGRVICPHGRTRRSRGGGLH